MYASKYDTRCVVGILSLNLFNVARCWKKNGRKKKQKNKTEINKYES